MKELNDVANLLNTAVERLVPRLLTQTCRDPLSANHGCFDRDWWHYKIRDFPSIILQQGGHSALLAAELPAFLEHADALRLLAAASTRFWARRAVLHHAFEEYYPWEAGYPPLAFSTLAAMRLLAAGAGDRQHLGPAAKVAARQLLARVERQAANQQVAGLAALAWVRCNYPELVEADRFERLKKRTLELQMREGWFMEYGGPDTGYLSVALDCLWDLFDATGDEAFLKAADQALDFLWTCVSITGSSLGMHNARNTDYILPYGIARCIVNRPTQRGVATALFLALYGRLDQPGHFLHAMDDRYLCHYSGRSLIRTVLLLRRHGRENPDLRLTAEDVPRRSEVFFEEAGLYLRKNEKTSLTISMGKGGIVSLRAGESFAHDFGWIARLGGRLHTSHWWSLTRWQRRKDGDTFSVEGSLVPVGDPESTPVKHMLLRLASLFLGPHLVRSLKQRMIFREDDSPYRFHRRIEIRGNDVFIRDEIAGVAEADEITPAPRSSRRHVASADTYHSEDLARVRGIPMRRETRRTGGAFVAETSYLLEDKP